MERLLLWVSKASGSGSMTVNSVPSGEWIDTTLTHHDEESYLYQ